jgi:hypothetical protein
MTMYWAPDLSEPVTLVTFLIGTVVLMKKLAEMDRYLELRVLVLTLLFSWFVLSFFLSFGSPFIDPIYPPCVPEHFCMTEM